MHIYQLIVDHPLICVFFLCIFIGSSVFIITHRNVLKWLARRDTNIYLEEILPRSTDAIDVCKLDIYIRPGHPPAVVLLGYSSQLRNWFFEKSKQKRLSILKYPSIITSNSTMIVKISQDSYDMKEIFTTMKEQGIISPNTKALRNAVFNIDGITHKNEE